MIKFFGLEEINVELVIDFVGLVPVVFPLEYV